MKLPGNDQEELALALRSAFPDRSKLAEFVSFRLEENLNEISGNGNLRSVVMELIHWAEGEGQTRRLIAEAQKRVPENPLLKITAPRLLAFIDKHPAGGSPATAPPIEVLGSLAIPPLPRFHVAREALLQLIADKLQLWGKRSSGVPLVIHGTRGIGKTTLAAEFALHRRTTKYFQGTVLWADLRRDPDPLKVLIRWLHELGETEFTPTEVEGARVRVRTLLHHRRALLLLDNASKPEQIEQLSVGGPDCSMLVTAWSAVIGEFCNARRFDVPPLTPREAVGLIEGLLDRPLRPQERDDAEELAKAVGYLPLALRLAAVRIERRDTWKSLLEALNQEIARLEALDSVGHPVGEETTIRAFLNVHLESLRSSDSDAWAALLRLAPLVHGVALTLGLAATVWRCDEARAKRVLDHLWSESLIAEAGMVESTSSASEDQPAWALHDLMHSHIQFLFAAPPPEGLDLLLAQGHNDLVDAYRERSPDGRWSSLPNDGYIAQMLGWHLEKAGRADDLHALFAEDNDQCNAWYAACKEREQLRHYASELQRAWRLAGSAAAETHDGRELGLACRYCLIDASLISLEQGFPPAAMLRLVQEGRWSPERGIDYALAARNEGIRARALSGLAGLVPEELLSYVSDGGQKLRDPRDRAEVWIELARNRQNRFREQAADAAWREIDRIGPALVRGDLFQRLAHATFGDTRRKAIASACNALGIESPARGREEGEALGRINSRLRERLGQQYRRERFPRAERWIEQISTDDLEARVTTPAPVNDSASLLRLRIACVPYLPGDRPREEAQPLLGQAFCRLSGTALVAAVRVLSGCLASRVPRPILTKARNISSSVDKCQILSFLLPHVELDQRESVANAIAQSAHRVMDNDIRAQVLHRAIPSVSPRLRVKVLNAARSMRDRDASAFALLSLARVYTGPAQEELKKMARRKTSGFADVELWFNWKLKVMMMTPEGEGDGDGRTTGSTAEASTGDAADLLAHLPAFALLGREMCADDLAALVPMALRSGGGSSIAELYQAAEDVGRWWP